MNKCKLGDLLTIKHGFPFKGEYFSDKGEYIVLTPGNFYETGGFKRILGKEKYYLGIFPEEYLCKKGDFIVAMTQQAEGLLGSTAFVPEDDIYLHNQRIGLISVNEQKADKYYLDYLFRTNEVRKQIRDSATGSKVKHTSPDRIYDVEVYIHDLETQKRIGALLHAIDSKILYNNKTCLELESMAKTIYDYWFLQFEFPNENGKPYKSSGGKMIWNEELKKEIPYGWRVMGIKKLLKVVTGKEDANFSSPSGNYKFFTCAQEVLQCAEYAFDGSAVLVAGNGDFNVKHYSGKFNAYQRTYVLIPDEKKYFAAIYLAVSERILQFKNGSNGSIVKFITKGDIEEIPILITEKDYLFDTINKILTAVEAKRLESEELLSLQKFILPLLMNGQAGFKE